MRTLRRASMGQDLGQQADARCRGALETLLSWSHGKLQPSHLGEHTPCAMQHWARILVSRPVCAAAAPRRPSSAALLARSRRCCALRISASSAHSSPADSSW